MLDRLLKRTVFGPGASRGAFQAAEPITINVTTSNARPITINITVVLLMPGRLRWGLCNVNKHQMYRNLLSGDGRLDFMSSSSRSRRDPKRDPKGSLPLPGRFFVCFAPFAEQNSVLKMQSSFYVFRAADYC